MLALKLSFSSSGWVIWPPNSVSSTPGFTFRIILSGSWHNLSLWHDFFPLKRVLCGIVPEMNHSFRRQILVSYITLALRFPSPVYLVLASLLSFLLVWEHSSFVSKISPVFSPRGWTLWYSNCFPLFSATSTSHPRSLSHSLSLTTPSLAFEGGQK